MAVPARAAVFDLFGTLVSWPAEPRYHLQMAQRLGIAYEAFRAQWRTSRGARDLGEIDARAALRDVCVALAVDADDARIADAASAWTAFLRETLVPRAGAAKAIAEMRSRDIATALLSDSPLEVAQVWPTTPLATLFDVTVFSCMERRLKPDPALYRTVAERLGIAVPSCVYIANGDGDELAGALRAGMRAVLFAASGETPGREAATWAGPRITSLQDAVSLTSVLTN